jgi:hypothetical protein
MEVIVREGAVDALLRHEHQVGRVGPGDALPDVLVLGDRAVLKEVLVAAGHLGKSDWYRMEIGLVTLSRYWSWNCFTTDFFSSSVL